MGIPSTKRVALHPGRLLSHLMEENELTQTDVATALKVTQAKISEIVHEKRGVTSEMAIKLGKFFETGPEIWCEMQSSWEIEVLNKKSVAKNVKTVEQYKKAA